MMSEQGRRVMDTIRHLAEFTSPFLLLAIVYFIKPIFDAVPLLQRQAEVAAVQQQTLVNQVAEVSVKQERVSAQVVQVGTKVEILGEKVGRLERKIDE